MKYNKIFSFNKKNLSHAFKDKIISDISEIDEHTLLFINKNDYHKITKEDHKRRTLILFEKDIIDINFLPLKSTQIYKRYKQLLKNLKFKQNNHLLDIKYMDCIIEDERFKISDKLHYTLLKGIIKKFNHIGLQTKNNRRFNLELYYKLINIITGNLYNRQRFNKEIKSFLSSDLIRRFNKENFDLEPIKTFVKKGSGIYSNKILLKSGKFNRDIFANNCFEFSYSKPLVKNVYSNTQTTISQDKIAKMYQTSQANISMRFKNRKLLYKFQVISEWEYGNILNSDSREYVFPMHTFAKHFNPETGDFTNKTYYLKSCGTKLYSNIRFKHWYFKDNKILKKDKLFKDSKGKKTSKIQARALSNHKRYNKTDTNTLNDFIYQTEKHQNSDFLRHDESQYDPFQTGFSDKFKHKDKLFIQLTALNYERLKEKLRFEFNTLSIYHSLRFLTTDKGMMRCYGLRFYQSPIKKLEGIGKFTWILLQNIHELKLDVQTIRKIRNKVLTNYQVYKKYACKRINSYQCYRLSIRKDMKEFQSSIKTQYEIGPIRKTKKEFQNTETFGLTNKELFKRLDQFVNDKIEKKRNRTKYSQYIRFDSCISYNGFDYKWSNLSDHHKDSPVFKDKEELKYIIKNQDKKENQEYIKQHFDVSQIKRNSKYRKKDSKDFLIRIDPKTDPYKNENKFLYKRSKELKEISKRNVERIIKGLEIDHSKFYFRNDDFNKEYKEYKYNNINDNSMSFISSESYSYESSLSIEDNNICPF